jgi:ABC-type multidrug transport system, ATPase and permease components
MNLYYFLKNHKKYVLLGPIFKLVEAVLEIIIPIVIANIIDLGVQNKDVSYIIKMGYFIVLLALLGFVSAIVCQYMAAKASQGIGKEIKIAVYEKINSISIDKIDKIGSASLVTRLSSDVNNLQNAIAMAIRLGIRVPFIIIGSLVMSFIIDKQLSVVFFISVPLISVILFFITLKSSRLFTLSRYKLDKLSSISKENIDGTRVIRAFSRQNHEINRFDKANSEYLNTGIFAAKIFSLMPPFAYTFVNSAIIAIIWMGAIKINSSQLEPGKITALINYITQILFALFLASTLLNIFTKSYSSYKRVFEILNIKDEAFPKNQILDTSKLNISSPKLEFRNISFSYPGHGKTELSNISFSVMQGETLGIIGNTGAGKTTITKLLLRFYLAGQGTILLDGQDILKYDAKTLHKKIKMAPQEAVLFSGTVEKNLRMGNSAISEEAIERALRISQASEFVNAMPNGIKSHVERGGKSLSGGQRQRLTVARAIAAEPEILVLDDSMSALDSGTGLKLKEALFSLKDTTKIIISQKCSNIWDANQILVLDSGESVGLGTHKYLLENCSIYKDIYKSQMQ